MLSIVGFEYPNFRLHNVTITENYSNLFLQDPNVVVVGCVVAA